MKQFVKFALSIMILGAFMLAGCSNALSPVPAVTKGGGLAISVSDGMGARTVFPKEVFSYYVLKFEGPPITSHEDEVLIGQSSIDVLLMDGDWKITADAYVVIDGNELLAATGFANVKMPADRLEITVRAERKTGTNGYFTYSVDYPSDVELDEAGLLIYDFAAGGLAAPEVNLFDKPSGTLELAPGFYVVIFRLANEIQGAVRQEVVHVYSNMETETVYEFKDEDFSGVITVGGSVDVTINGAAAEKASVKVTLANGTLLGEAEAEDGAWSVSFIEPPDANVIAVEFTAESGNVKVVEKPADINIQTAGSLDETDFSRVITAAFTGAPTYNINTNLSVGAPSVSGAGTLGYQWQSDGANIAGANTATRLLAVSDAGRLMSCNISYAAGGNTGAVTVTGKKVNYAINILRSGVVAGDVLSFSDSSNSYGTYGATGDEITLYYAIIADKKYNALHFSGIEMPSILCDPDEGDSGELAYTVTDADADASGVITITAAFEHSAKWINDIYFEKAGAQRVVYGDGSFTNVIDAERIDGDGSTPVITYSGNNNTVATVNSTTGEVTILKVGSVVITARKAEDSEYAESSATYTLTVAQKPVTVGGITVQDKIYDATTTLQWSDGGVTLLPIEGVEGLDDVSAVRNTAVVPSFANKNAGDNKPLVFSFTLVGADMGNYVLANPAVSLTANITKRDAAIVNLPVADKPWDGFTEASVSPVPNAASGNVSGRQGTDNVYPAGGRAFFQNPDVGNGKTVTFEEWDLAGADAGNYNLTSRAPANGTGNIVKATPPVTWPDTLTTTYGSALSAIDLSGFTNAAGIPGAFQWVTPTTLTGSANGSGTLRVGLQQHAIKFVPAAGDAADHYDEITTNLNVRVTLGMAMVQINAGSFTMGSNSTADSGAYPPHPVVITRAFNMGTYPVTRREYEAVTGTQPSVMQGNVASGNIEYNVSVAVNWYEAVVYCNMLSVAEGYTPAYEKPASGTDAASFAGWSTDTTTWGNAPINSNNVLWNGIRVVSGSTGYRLPTEAQWEYACRAGTTTAWWNGETANTDTGWYEGNSGSSNTLHDTANAKGPNNRGLYNMAGNIRELCWDWYGDYAVGGMQEIDPTGATTGTLRVSRGGSCGDGGTYMRSAHRYYNYAYSRDYRVGFRLCRP